MHNSGWGVDLHMDFVIELSSVGLVWVREAIIAGARIVRKVGMNRRRRARENVETIDDQ